MGLVVRVSTMLLRRALRRNGILKFWWGDVLELVDGREVDELEVEVEVVGVDVGVCVLV